MLTRRRAIAVKLETTYRTDSVPTSSADAIEVEDPTWAITDNRTGTRKTAGGFGGLKDVKAGELVEVTFMVPLQGSSAAGTAGDIDPLLQIAGYDAPTVVASTSVTYDTLLESSIKSASCYFWDDGKLIKLVGCRGNISGALTIGDAYGKLSYTLKGHLASNPTDLAYPSSFTFDNVEPPPLKNLSGLLLGGAYVPEISSLTFELGNVLTPSDSMYEANGFGEIVITDRDIVGTFDPLDTLVATQDWFDDWKQGTSKTLTTGVIGSTAGNRYSIAFSDVYYRELSSEDRNGLTGNTIGFHSVGTMTIAYT